MVPLTINYIKNSSIKNEKDFKLRESQGECIVHKGSKIPETDWNKLNEGNIPDVAKNELAKTECSFSWEKYLHLYSSRAIMADGYARYCYISHDKGGLNLMEMHDMRAAGYSSLWGILKKELGSRGVKVESDKIYIRFSQINILIQVINTIEVNLKNQVYELRTCGHEIKDGCYYHVVRYFTK